MRARSVNDAKSGHRAATKQSNAHYLHLYNNYIGQLRLNRNGQIRTNPITDRNIFAILKNNWRKTL